MKCLIAFLACLLPCLIASADVVKLKDGRSFEGTVVEQNDQKVVIKTKFGLNELARSEVESVEIKATPAQEFRDRREKAEGDAKALFDLYAWAMTNGLKTQAKQALRDVVKLDENHAEARQLLGYVLHEGKWVSEREKERLDSQAERTAMEAKGLVEYKGKWMTPEEKETAEMTAKGFVKVDGEWVNERARKAKEEAAAFRKQIEEHKAKGEFFVAGKWVPKKAAEAFYADLQSPYLSEAKNVRLYTNNGIDFGDKMLVTAEAAFRKSEEFFGKAINTEDQKMNVYVVTNTEDYNRLGNEWNADEQSSNFYAFATPWLGENDRGLDLVTVTQYALAESLTDIYVQHASAEQFVLRMIGQNATDIPPRWFSGAVACYLSRFQAPKLFSWSRDKLIATGGVLKLKSFFSGYLPDENHILSGGIIVAFLKSPDCPKELKEEFESVLEAVKEGDKVQKAFRGLEKSLIKYEDAFREFADL
ncbi:MAG: hypothetical protein V2A76_08090 [Planctomycetota bacterium]